LATTSNAMARCAERLRPCQRACRLTVLLSHGVNQSTAVELLAELNQVTGVALCSNGATHVCSGRTAASDLYYQVTCAALSLCNNVGLVPRQAQLLQVCPLISKYWMDAWAEAPLLMSLCLPCMSYHRPVSRLHPQCALNTTWPACPTTCYEQRQMVHLDQVSPSLSCKGSAVHAHCQPHLCRAPRCTPR
jgi:hypothetical protein